MTPDDERRLREIKAQMADQQWAAGGTVHFLLRLLKEAQEREAKVMKLVCEASAKVDTVDYRLREAMVALDASPAEPLLHEPTVSAPKRCYCQPGRCMAPVIMGHQTPCLDPAKRDAKPTTLPGDCANLKYSSRVCERGTRGCEVRHIEPPTESGRGGNER